MNQSLQVIHAADIPKTQKILQIIQAISGKKLVECDGNTAIFYINDGYITITVTEDHPISGMSIKKIEDYIAGIQKRVI